MRPGKDRGLDRRDFIAAAVAIGGSSALSACLDIEARSETETATGTPAETASGTTQDESEAVDFPRGNAPEELPAAQHTWNEYLVHDMTGNTALPRHQLVLGLEYVGSTPPTAAERAQVEGAMATLDRAFQWGTGGDPSASLAEGLLSMLGYAPRYFAAMEESVEGLLAPEALLEAVDEDPALADPFDATLVLNSDYGAIVLAAEAALFGEREQLNGVPVEDTFEGVFELADRRSGVVGRGLPAEETDHEGIPEEAPLSMGFRSSFADNQAAEEAVTIDDGPFAGGTTLQASRLRINLDRWYDQDADERVGTMFTPRLDEDDLSETGDRLGSESGITEADAENVAETAGEHDALGHTQKVARARDEDFEPTILRRTEAVATDAEFAEGVGFNFTSIQDDVQRFVEVRRAMHPDEYDVDVDDPHHGIVDYLETMARGVYVVPPRSDRALPTP